ncbi:50S ribosomal protein L5 [Candidatus Saccharibacteria bacterium]|nr:50S ribosomal protein L5 [Candidatus Saccharibacteria bacterium]
MAVSAEAKPKYRSRLKDNYMAVIRKELLAELGLANPHQVPRLEKIVLNTGLGRAQDDKRLLEAAINTLRKITGQQPVATTAKKSIAAFKLRQGSKIGLQVTLRGDRMYEFADRFINIVLPRLRDFHGVNAQAFDKQGNYAIGLSDQSSFPELSYEDTATAHGLQINFVINSLEPAHTRALLEKLGLPFEKPQPKAKKGES